MAGGLDSEWMGNMSFVSNLNLNYTSVSTCRIRFWPLLLLICSKLIRGTGYSPYRIILSYCSSASNGLLSSRNVDNPNLLLRIGRGDKEKRRTTTTTTPSSAFVYLYVDAPHTHTQWVCYLVVQTTCLWKPCAADIVFRFFFFFFVCCRKCEMRNASTSGINGTALIH